VPAQRPFDLLIRNARVLDPGSGFDAVTDVGVRDGRVTDIWPGLAGADGRARRDIDGTGLVLTPGLVDLHTHVFDGGSYWGIRPDPIAATSGVTTWVDAGSAGAYTVRAFRRTVSDYSVHTKAFLHVAGVGLAGQTGESVTLLTVDVEAAVDAVQAHRDLVCGIKVRSDRNAVRDNGLEPLRRALTVAERTGLPLMVHVGHPPPGADEALALMRPGDILTHCFTGVTTGLLAEPRRSGRPAAVHPAARAAYERGVVFDLGHGSGGFDFEVAEAFAAEGIHPTTVSTDLHARSLTGPAFDLPHTMTKMLALGMSFPQVLAAATVVPARLAGLPERTGTLVVDAPADLALWRLVDEPVEVADAHRHLRTAPSRLVNVATFVDGHELSVTTPADPPSWIARSRPVADALAGRRDSLRAMLVPPLIPADQIEEQFPPDRREQR
jgi:dihydroorotase